MAGTDRASFKSEAATDRSAQADAGGWRPEARPAAFFALSAALVAICALATFNRATTPWSTLPDNDYWINVTGLITADGVKLTLGNLFRHNNEHIIVIPKLVYAANYWLTSGSNVGLIVYSLALGAACTAVLLWLALPLFRDAPIRMMLCAVLFPLAMFSAKLSHSYFLGMSGTIWLTADLFVILSAAALARAVAQQSACWLLAALLAALLGVLSYSTAVYSLLTLLIACVALLLLPRLRGAMSWAVPAAMACAALLVLVLGAVYRNLPPHHPAWSFDLVELAHFVLLYIGTALAAGHLRWITGLAILAAGTAAILRLAIHGRIGETLAWIVLFFYAPFNGLIDRHRPARSRQRDRVEQPLPVRHRHQPDRRHHARARRPAARPSVARASSVARGAVVAALIAVAVVLAANRAFVRKNVARNEGKAIAEIALRQGIQGQHHLKVVTPVIMELENMLPELRAVPACAVPLAIRLRGAARHAPAGDFRPCQRHGGILVGLPRLARHCPRDRAHRLGRARRVRGRLRRHRRWHPDRDRRRRLGVGTARYRARQGSDFARPDRVEGGRNDAAIDADLRARALSRRHRQ